MPNLLLHSAVATLTVIISVPRPPRDGVVRGGATVVVLGPAAVAPLAALGLAEEVDEEPERLRGLPRLLLHPSPAGYVKLTLSFF